MHTDHDREAGGGLVTVLVVSVILTTLAALLVGSVVSRTTQARRAAHDLQAAYALDSLLHATVADAVTPQGLSEPLVPLTPRSVTVVPWGGFVEGEAWADPFSRQRRRRRHAKLLLGRTWAPRHALTVGDSLRPLVLAGTTSLRGPIQTLSDDVLREPLQGRAYKGRIEGDVQRAYADPLPAFDPAHLDLTLQVALDHVEGVPPGIAARRLSDVEMGALDPHTIVVGGDGAVVLSRADSAWIQAVRPGTGDRLVVLSRGDFEVRGPVALPEGTLLAARGRVRLVGAVQASDLLVVADAIETEGPLDVQGQLLAQSRLDVGDAARLRYPSLVYLAVQDPGPDGALSIQGAEVQGSVVVSGGPDDPSIVRLTTAPDTRIRGLVYADRTADLRGRVDGAVYVRRLQFVEGASTYLGWLRDLTVDLEAAPDPLVVPFGLAPEASEGILLSERSTAYPADE